MIPVAPAPEPANFDEMVRQPGRWAIRKLADELSGSKDDIPPSLDCLARHAPFVMKELRRHGRLRAG